VEKELEMGLALRQKERRQAEERAMDELRRKEERLEREAEQLQEAVRSGIGWQLQEPIVVCVRRLEGLLGRILAVMNGMREVNRARR